MTGRPLRLVVLGHSAALSGAELGLVELIAALEGTTTTVVLAEPGPLVRRLELAGASVEVLPLDDRARGLERGRARLRRLDAIGAGVATVGYSLSLARRLRRLRPDLVHANTLKSLLYGAGAARIAGVPLVWHAHDRISEDYLPGTAVHVVRGVARLRASGVIANSDATLATLGSLRVPTLVAPEPVRYEAFRHPRRAREDDPFTVAMVGRIAPWKGQDIFLHAFAEAFPDGPQRGIVVGAPLFGEEEYERSLVDLVRQLGLDRRVELRGFRDDIGAELARADALVHASVIPEPFGRVIVEGMAAGLPVVAADGGGPREIITDGVDGLLYPPGSVGALASRMRQLAHDPGLAGRLGRAAAARALDFSPELVGRTVGAFYEQVLAEAGARA
jgi:glycosyltransferase involved in cell wall biosynthesis